MSHRAFAVLLIFAGFVATTGADAAPASRPLADDPRVGDAVAAWETWLEYQLAVQRVPGASTGIVHDQELISARGFGAANPEAGIAATPDTLYSICSISKLFTAIALMQLRDEGVLRLDDPVADHLDWFEIRDEHADDEAITIRRLLNHSSGLPRESDYPYWSQPDFRFPTHEEIVERLGEQSTLYPASRYFQYSNLGLTLVGEIVASSSGQDYHERVRSGILQPLGMGDTTSEIPAAEWGKRLAVGHSALGRDGARKAIPLFQTRGIAPAAGFASNVLDMARFASWQFRLLGSASEEILRPATLREMQRVQWVDPDWQTTRGLGFNVWQSNDRTYVSHGGGCPGYYTQFVLEPARELGVIVLTNAIGSAVELYAEKAAELIGPAIDEATQDPEGAPARDAGLDRYLGIYDRAWGQASVLRWKGSLAYLWLPSRDPKADLIELKQVRDHVFRRVRTDDESLGEEFVFEVAEDGRVLRLKQHSNWQVKVR
jgi:CubicO group peptidase (beta-lactamase class C family)